ncbi:hypothetical protein PFICI_13706 [Pestalotiopsis fici W106-1]|uniref:Uncharacterized protein n=1 Tax=Pestalotiopsis fici (strain W106-1 / CGMCC3.15140) TaxID=1229662 RepID=W3WQ22_PESFW|nr:uncharacterized protein PFICI_13706 [Pestalotiopsis fici W106-1]ETS75222.1 hypothetical protein PFICI_13706 [Pestalotiopsis fici W106-1]
MAALPYRPSNAEQRRYYFGLARTAGLGDPGTCVFDLDGRIIGMITGGARVGAKDQKVWRGLSQEGSSSKVGPEAEQTGADSMPQWGNGTDVTFVSPIE